MSGTEGAMQVMVFLNNCVCDFLNLLSFLGGVYFLNIRFFVIVVGMCVIGALTRSLLCFVVGCYET